MGPLPLHKDIQIEVAAPEQTAAPAVLQDGSYASQSYVEASDSTDLTVLSLRHLLLVPSYFAFSALCNALASLCPMLDGEARKAATLQSLLLISGVLTELNDGIDDLNRTRVAFCIQCLLDPALEGVAAKLKAMNESSGVWLRV